jgi:predicted TIM-barrel fold metal-dependent hydrolase
MLEGLGLSRVVIVQPSIYGTDNGCLLAALDELGPMARGVVVLAPDTPSATLDALHRQAVRGIRVNVASVQGMGPREVQQQFRAAARLCERNGWHLQTFLPAMMLAELPDLADLPVPLVLDHFGLISPERPDGPEAHALLSRLDTGRVWVKLSAPYRITERTMDPRVAELARMLARNPERLVWGSDWPHTPAHAGSGTAPEEETPYRNLDTQDLLAQVRTWFPEAAMQRRLLVDNPAQAYGWSTWTALDTAPS